MYLSAVLIRLYGIVVQTTEETYLQTRKLKYRRPNEAAFDWQAGAGAISLEPNGLLSRAGYDE